MLNETFTVIFKHRDIVLISFLWCYFTTYLVTTKEVRESRDDHQRETDLPCGSEHVKYKMRFRSDEMFFAYGGKSGLNGGAKDETQRLEEWKQWLKKENF